MQSNGGIDLILLHDRQLDPQTKVEISANVIPLVQLGSKASNFGLVRFTRTLEDSSVITAECNDRGHIGYAFIDSRVSDALTFVCICI